MIVPPGAAACRRFLPGRHPALLLQGVQQGIQRAGLQVEGVIRPAAQLLDHLIAVHVLLLQQLHQQQLCAARGQRLVKFHGGPPCCVE